METNIRRASFARKMCVYVGVSAWLLFVAGALWGLLGTNDDGLVPPERARFAFWMMLGALPVAMAAKVFFDYYGRMLRRAYRVQ